MLRSHPLRFNFIHLNKCLLHLLTLYLPGHIIIAILIPHRQHSCIITYKAKRNNSNDITVLQSDRERSWSAV